MAFREHVTIILNIIALTFFIIGLVLFESILKPFHRGFFCNDQSIQKPYIEKQTVTTTTLVAVSMLLVIFTVSIFTYLRLIFPPYRNQSVDLYCMKIGYVCNQVGLIGKARKKKKFFR